MAVYVDNVRIEWRGYLWCHLVADTEAELHAFAKQLGLKRAWYQTDASYPHYDVTVEVRSLLVPKNLKTRECNYLMVPRIMMLCPVFDSLAFD